MTDKFHVHVDESVLNIEDANAFVSDSAAGGIVTFAGTTRGVTDGKITLQLSYEAYGEMACSELSKLVQRCIEVYGLSKVYVGHRLGVVPVGEASVLIAVSSPHRSAAFEACRFIIDELKVQIPIWKKETFADGSTEWIEGGSLPSV